MTLTSQEASRFCDQRGDNQVLFISRCLRQVAIGTAPFERGADGESRAGVPLSGLSATMLSPQMEQAMQAMGSLLPTRCCAMLSCANLTLHRTQIAFNSWFRGEVAPSFRSTTKQAGQQASSLSRCVSEASQHVLFYVSPTFPICFLSAFCYLKSVSSWGYSSVGRASRSQ